MKHTTRGVTAPLLEAVSQPIETNNNLVINLVPQTCFKKLHFYTQNKAIISETVHVLANFLQHHKREKI